MLLAAQQLADLVGRLSVVLFYGVRVDVHGGCRHAVAEPVLHGLDVRPVADEERRLGVTKIVELQPLVVRPLDAGIPRESTYLIARPCPPCAVDNRTPEQARINVHIRGSWVCNNGVTS